MLERESVIQRRAAGTGEVQLIAANTDTVFVVTLCNADFKLAWLERYAGLDTALGMTRRSTSSVFRSIRD